MHKPLVIYGGKTTTSINIIIPHDEPLYSPNQMPYFYRLCRKHDFKEYATCILKRQYHIDFTILSQFRVIESDSRVWCLTPEVKPLG